MVIQNETCRDKTMKKVKRNMNKLWHNSRKPNILVIGGFPKDEGGRKIFEKTMVNIFLNMEN